jgi:glycosyltransferase involved in cell wall biosynthesis
MTPHRHETVNMGDAPELSVIIPTYNRREVLLLTLDALARQDIDPSRFEVLVVDDGSTDRTGDVLQAFRTRAPYKLVCDRQDNSGANAARNRAVHLAKARVLVSIDDDCIPTPGMLAAHYRFHRAKPGLEWAAVGKLVTDPSIAHSVFTAMHAAQWEALNGRDELPWTCLFTGNCSLKREYLVQHGLFDEGMRWHEDIELAERLRHHGLRLAFLPDAVAYHHDNMQEQNFLRMAKREGESLVAWYRKAPHLKEELTELGLSGPRPFRRELRHRVADWGISVVTFGGALRLARATAQVSPALAGVLYAKLFQFTKRRAVEKALIRSKIPG